MCAYDLTVWLINQGGADPKRIGIMGRSYGGFMVLAAITSYPDLWAAAVDIAGITNFLTFFDEGHFMLRQSTQLKAYPAIGDWFEHYMG